MEEIAALENLMSRLDSSIQAGRTRLNQRKREGNNFEKQSAEQRAKALCSGGPQRSESVDALGAPTMQLFGLRCQSLSESRDYRDRFKGKSSAPTTRWNTSCSAQSFGRGY